MLIDRVLQAVDRTPFAPAFQYGGRAISYGQMRALIARAVVHLRRQGVKRGEVVAFSFGQTPLYPVLLLAMGWIGALTVPIAPTLRAQDRAAILRKLGVTAFVTDRLEVVPDGCRLVQVESLGAQGNETMREAGERGFDADTPFRLALTTGTTGLPKSVLQTHANFEERMDRMHCDVAEVPRVIPPSMHITISINLVMHALCKGGMIVFPENYANVGFFEAVRAFEVTHVTLPPANLGLMLPDLPAGKPSFPSVRHLRLVGSTPTRSIVEQAFDRFTPHVFVPYGLGEVGLVSMATPAILRDDPGCAGVLEPGVRLQMTDAGEISVHIPGQPADYYGPDAGLATRFRGDGFFHPGDRGRLTAEGRLYIEGRIDNIINVDGIKMSPEFIESILMEFKGVREAAVFASVDESGSTRIAAAIVPQGEIDWKVLGSYATQRLHVTAPVRYLEVESLPRNAMGKLERNLVSEAALAGAKVRA